jgi:hypothetical protein
MKRVIWIFLAITWVSGAVAAFICRNTLAESELGKLVLMALGVPLVFVLYMIAEGLGEGVVFLLMVAAFKVVTFGLIRTEFMSQALFFPWYGIARDHDGRLVASEACVYIIGTAVYLAAGASLYFWQS